MSAKQINWNDLTFFLELVRTGNPAAAGKRMKVDHTTVRRRIAALEESLGVTLFSSKGLPYELNADGDKLLKYAEAIETLVIRATEEVANRDLFVSGTVKIGAPEGFGTKILAPRLPELCQLHPELKLQLSIVRGDVDLVNREVDIAIAFDLPRQSQFIVRKLGQYSLCMYSTEKYITSVPKLKTAEDLGNHRVVGYYSDDRFTAEVIDPGEVFSMQSASILAQLAAVAEGHGIGVLPDFLASSDDRLVPVLPDVTGITKDLWLVVHPQVINLARIRVVLDFIFDVVRQEKALLLRSL